MRLHLRSGSGWSAHTRQGAGSGPSSPPWPPTQCHGAAAWARGRRVAGGADGRSMCTHASIGGESGCAPRPPITSKGRGGVQGPQPHAVPVCGANRTARRRPRTRRASSAARGRLRLPTPPPLRPRLPHLGGGGGVDRRVPAFRRGARSHGRGARVAPGAGTCDAARPRTGPPPD